MTSSQGISYFDSSVILRYAIGHEMAVKSLAGFSKMAVTSSITVVECLRVLDRWRITKEISDDKLVAARSLCLKIFSGLRLIPVDETIISSASQTFPIALKSLDAIHLASAIQVRNQSNQDITILTHDAKLAMASISMNMTVHPS